MQIVVGEAHAECITELVDQSVRILDEASASDSPAGILSDGPLLENVRVLRTGYDADDMIVGRYCCCVIGRLLCNADS